MLPSFESSHKSYQTGMVIDTFTDKEIEAPRSQITYPESQNQEMVDLAFELRTTATSETVLEP